MASTAASQPALSASRRYWHSGVRVFRRVGLRIITKSGRLWLTVVIGTLAGVPVLVLHHVPATGVYINATAAVLLTTLALAYAPARKVAIAGAIIPVAYMLPISLPQTSSLSQAACFYSGLLLLSLAYRYLFITEEKERHSLTVRGYAVTLPLVIVVGQILAVIAFGLLPHTRPFAPVSTALLSVIAVVFAFIEAIFFQGLLQSSAAQAMPPLSAAVLATFLYACLSTTFSAPVIIFSVLAGASFAMMYYFRQSVVLVMVSNAVMKLLFIGLLATFAR